MKTIIDKSNTAENPDWKRKYPTFPGMSTCAELLHSPTVKGEWVEIICYQLREHAVGERLAELIQVVLTEEDARLRRVLLSTIPDERLSDAVALLAPHLPYAEREEEVAMPDRTCVVEALREIGTREAHALLWGAGFRPGSSE